MPRVSGTSAVDNYAGVALWRQFGPSAKLVSARGSNMALADTVLYTCPANKKAIFAPANGAHAAQFICYNPTAGAAVVKQWIVPAAGATGLSNQINQVSIGATNSGYLTISGMIVLNAGDQVYINPGAAGLNIWLSFIEADIADMPVAGNFVGAIGATATLIYTCPTGKKAYLSNSGFGAFNQSGAAANLQFWLVPSGGVADATNFASVISAVPALSRGTAVPCPPYVLSAGDAIYAAGSVAGSFNVWAFVALEP